MEQVQSPWLYSYQYRLSTDNNMTGYIGVYLFRFEFNGDDGGTERGIYVGSSIAKGGMGKGIRGHFKPSRNGLALYDKLPMDYNLVDIRILCSMRMEEIYRTFGRNVKAQVVVDMIKTIFILRLNSYNTPAITNAKTEANYRWNTENATGLNLRLQVHVRRHQ